MKQITYILLLCLLPTLSVTAQKVYNDQVSVENISATRSKDNHLLIAMDLILEKNMQVASNRAVTITPLLSTNTYNKSFPLIAIYGRRRLAVTERNNQLPKEAYKIIHRRDNERQRIKYLAQLPYKTWMQNANIQLNFDVSGCCDQMQGNPVEQKIYRLNIEPSKPQLHIAYITPKAEAVKHRATTGRAFLDFSVNQIIINPDYRKNQDELAKIRATIDTIRNDRNVAITSITLEGFASPEGTYASNIRLAEGRTNALMRYVRSYYNFDSKQMKVSSTPEDWAGFRKYIEASDFSMKQEILQVIDSNQPCYDLKEKSIAKLVGADNYRIILSECYPTLRHSDYVVNYTVRGFTMEEAKSIIDKNPQQLSLQEIFNVAQTYTKGSEEFNHAFQVAVLMFPDDEIANMNAAAMEIQKGGDLTAAKKYLSKANQAAAETLNNWGVIALIEGDLNKAEEYFNKAGKAGNTGESTSNLEEVAKQRGYLDE